MFSKFHWKTDVEHIRLKIKFLEEARVALEAKLKELYSLLKRLEG